MYIYIYIRVHLLLNGLKRQRVSVECLKPASKIRLRLSKEAYALLQQLGDEMDQDEIKGPLYAAL